MKAMILISVGLLIFSTLSIAGGRGMQRFALGLAIAFLVLFLAVTVVMELSA